MNIRNLLSIVGIVGLVVVLAVYFIFDIKPARYEDKALADEVRDLKEIESALASGSSPTNVDLAIGFSEHGLSSALETFQGVKATSQDFGGITLEVVRSQLEFEPGYVHVRLDVTASRNGLPIDVTLTTKCDLLLEGVDLGEPGEAVPHPSTVCPSERLVSSLALL